jgi:hypothetical protein
MEVATTPVATKRGAKLASSGELVREPLENIRDEIAEEMHRDCDPKVSLVDVRHP